MKKIILIVYSIMGIIMIPDYTVDAKEKKSEKNRKSLSYEEYLTGRFKASKQNNFRKIDSGFSNGEPHYLLKEAAQAFEKMAKAALKDKISLYVVSGFRSFNSQKQIFEEKFLGHRLVEGENLLQKYPKDPQKRVLLILKFSAAPGTSRHHWGTDCDINSTSPEYFETEAGKKIYNWLVENAPKYGFYQPFTHGRKTGYSEEKWHWSYKPVSLKLLKDFIEKIPLESLNDFSSFDFLPVNLYENYVLAINKELLPENLKSSK